MLSCKEVSKLVSQSQDRTLNIKERIAVKMHLLMCNMCRRYQKQIIFLTEASRRFLKETPQDELSLPENAKARIEQALEQAAEQEPGKSVD